MFSKIITHAGVFHADEILAISTIIQFVQPNIPIERKFQVTEDEFSDPSILVLDLGKRLEPSLSNFDHHQNGDIEATNLLVLRHFCKDTRLVKKLEQHLFSYVSDVDRGIIPNGGGIATFNAIVRNFNNIDSGFELALTTAQNILNAYIVTATQAIEGEIRWSNLQRLENGRIAFDKEGVFIPDWKDLANKDGVFILASPNARGGFQLVSRNSEELNIPIGDGQTFRHPSGFMAVYETEGLALKHAIAIVNL